MHSPIPDPLDRYLSEADAARDRVDRELYPLRLLDITRKTRAAIPDAEALLLDLSERWERPIGPTVVAVHSTSTWSSVDPPRWLRDWRSPQGHEWPVVVAHIEQQLTTALGLHSPDRFGWTKEPSGLWKVDLLDQIAVNALTAFQTAVLVSTDEDPWVHLDHFHDGGGATFFARRNCSSCSGEGFVEAVPPQPNGGEADTCHCVRRLPG